MATASRTRQPPGAKQPARSAAIAARLPRDLLRLWLVPAVGSIVIVVAAVLSAAELLPTPTALAAAIIAALVLLLYVGERPLLEAQRGGRERVLGAALGAAWLAACYVPFHARIFPGTSLLAPAELSASGAGLPLRIPAAGHAAVDLLLGGRLTPLAGGAAAPLHYRLTIEAESGASQVVEGTFEDTLRTRRLGRRGTTVVHQLHTAEVRLLSNPGRQDLTVTQLVLEPATAEPITLAAFVHPLPGLIVLALAVIILLGAVIVFDRLGPIPETDGALTLATAAVLGTAIVIWTSDTAHPDFQTLIGSAIFGGPLGFAVGALAWWIAKRLVVLRTR
jgi:hypothetical protein